MEIVLAHLYSNVHRHSHRHDRGRHVHRGRRIDDDRLFRAHGGAFHIPGSRHIFVADTVSWAVFNVVAT